MAEFSTRSIVKTFSALADETRLRILSLLLERECCVCEIMQALEISQSRASRGLTALYDAGLLKLKKEGLWSIYSLDREGMAGYQLKLAEAARESLAGSKVAALDKNRLNKAVRIIPGRDTALAGSVPCCRNPR